MSEEKPSIKTITYMRPSGRPLVVADNAANRAYAEANGWTVEKGAKAEKPKE